MLKPQDIYALTGLQVLLRRWQRPVTLPQLAALVRVSISETHAAMDRLEKCQLLAAATMDMREPLATNFLELAEHGLRYVYPPELGPPTRGIPTAAAVVAGLAAPSQPFVWPHESGGAYGVTLVPLYRTVPAACAIDHDLHVAMAALDCLRVGKPRERQAGLKHLRLLFGAA